MLSASKSGSGAVSGYNLTRSLRFRASASAYLNRTPAAGNQKTWTWSAWVKRGTLSTAQALFDTGVATASDSTFARFGFEPADTFSFNAYNQAWRTTTQVFRDPSAWYHIVLAFDTTQATAANRVKLYVNGVQVTAFSVSNDPTINTNYAINQAAVHYFSYPAYTYSYFDGYLTEVNFIDGQALTPTSFGSTNSLTGVWQPARYTGTYGTNGFYLPFSVSSTSSYAGQTNGSSQYLSIASSNALQFGSSDYTAEMWVLRTSQAAQAFVIGGGGSIFQWGLSTSGTMQVSLAGAGSVTASTGSVPLNVWTHIAVARVSGTLTYYINGVASGSYSDANNYSTGSLTVNISATNNNAGYSLVGYLSNVRIVKGTAVYTAAFTPPSSPLTAVTNTSLLTLQNTTIIDNSTNAASITNNGSVTTSVVYPFTTNVAADASGNSNNWTTNNISLAAGVTYDSMTDVPTLTSATAANFATLNPLQLPSATLSNGNLTASGGSAFSISTIGMSSGKFYAEMTVTTVGGESSCGISQGGYTTQTGTAVGTTLNGGATAYGYLNDGSKFSNGVNPAYGSSYTSGDVIGIAFDATAGTLTFYKNNTSQGSAYTGLTSGPYFFAVEGRVGGGTNNVSINFGQRPFTYTAPTGYVALNTFNLPDSTLVKGNAVMDATLYTGTLLSNSITNAASFKPDFVWLKSRSAITDNKLTDSVRGVTKGLISNTTGAETTDTQGLTAFNTNGFTVGTDTVYNNLAATYVAWQWQAGQGSSSSNTNGTITSTVSVNASAGFSIVKFATGSSWTGGTVGHGLGVAPAMFVVKNINGPTNTNWNVYHQSLGNMLYLNLNNTGASGSSSTLWNATNPTSTVFSLGSYAYSNSDMLAYCWTPIAGFSAFGSLTGNGSTDGVFVYLGFKPRFILYKRTDSTSDWRIWDTARTPYNAMSSILYPDVSDAEYTASTQDFDALSNGFKIRNSSAAMNASGGTYIYAAFASNPFRNSLAQ